MRPTLTQNDIHAAFNAGAMARGTSYFKQRKVVSWDIKSPGRASRQGESNITATTLGSADNVYHQDISFFKFRNEMTIEGDCSCPVRFNCKHVAAVCLEVMNIAAPRPASDTPLNSDDGLSPELTDWLSELSGKPTNKGFHRNVPTDLLVYLLQPSSLTRSIGEDQQNISAIIKATRRKKNGKGYIKGRQLSPIVVTESVTQYSCVIEQIDVDIAYFLAGLDDAYHWVSEVALRRKSGALALQQMVESGRCFWLSVDSAPLTVGASKTYAMRWDKSGTDYLQLATNLESHISLVATDPPMYIDTHSGEVGLLESADWSANQLSNLLKAPKLKLNQREQMTHALLQRFPNLPLPTPTKVSITEIQGVSPTPMLFLSQFYLPEHGQSIHNLRLDFDYKGYVVQPNPPSSIHTIKQGKNWLRINRDRPAEQAALAMLFDLGFQTIEHSAIKDGSHHLFSPEDKPLQSITRWADLLDTQLARLAALGWHIQQEERFSLTFQEADWNSTIVDDLDEDGNPNQWFSLRFDLTVGDKKIPLAPIVESALASLSDAGELPEHFVLAIGEHRYVKLPSVRLKPIFDTLTELFNRADPNEAGEFKISKYDAGALNDLLRQDIVIQGGRKLQQLARQLDDFTRIAEVPVPEELKAELRPYQRAGLNWLQFLRQYEFNGILADDMGLGKTVQALANVLVEKNARRLNKPVLVVAPTSLVGNWRTEAQRFTPSLSILIWHGGQRHSQYHQIGLNDVVITTYPLLARDAEKLSAIDFQMVILDEAQLIKNSNTKLAKAVRQLKTRHKLCLTGTPLENNLGELWSLFDFLMPGFLGSRKEFNRIYRKPIEQDADLDQQTKLAKRVQPFLLRRLKNDVANDLPPKTIITQKVVFDQSQAELYESIRISMDEKVRKVIAARGLARSHITILDALLKLRQVCCDPRLLKLSHTVQSHRSAKLERLMEMLPEQIAEGRRVLLFSQFTSMLRLIEVELERENIPYTKLTGQTRDREQAIAQFRNGDVNLFLISLKAGGVGLNLTEADTVIIYDPWWNPAAEMQAIDRAHRIGQNKPIFVYKLVAENTVEEKMLDMQERKRVLAAGIIDANATDSGNPLIDSDTLRSLFDPIQGDAT